MEKIHETLYGRIRTEVGLRAERLWEVSLALHRAPELSFEEHRAADLLTAELRGGGFEVERGAAGLDTAFVATAGRGRGPRVALLLEYDALPKIGHACGHNLIAAAGLGAALAVREALQPIDGTVMAVGTPAEEGGGGKAIEADAGIFDGVDAALMFHPGVHSWSWAPLTAQVQVRAGFHGRAAHPTGNPAEGIDALAALVQLFNALGPLRARLPAASHIQGIITEGGTATNIVPEYAEGVFGLRAATTSALERLEARFAECARGTAQATGCTVRVERASTAYDHFRDNEVLSGRFAGHLERAGIPMSEPDAGVYLGSSDIGNVSVRVPAIHPFVAIMDSGASDHTVEFAEAAAGPRARLAMLAATEALACTAADVLTDPGMRQRAWDRLREKAAAGG